MLALTASIGAKLSFLQTMVRHVAPSLLQKWLAFRFQTKEIAVQSGKTVVTFRKLQAILDLQSAALHLLDSLNPDLDSYEVQIQQQLRNLWANRIHEWSLELPATSLAPLIEVACSPEEDPQRFLFSTCALLLDRFSRPDRGGDFLWEWEAYEEYYCAAPAPIRSAIMNGFWVGRQHALVSDKIIPTLPQRTSVTKQCVIPPLLAIAQAMTPEEMSATAAADYGCDIDKHVDALRQLLSTRDCRFPKGEVWYPAEVVELVSHDPNAVGFLPCTAILLINAIYSGNCRGEADYRWHTKSTSYLTLEPLHRVPFLAAFRYLYETLEHWDPHWGKSWPERLPVEKFLPWLPDQRQAPTP